MDEYIEIPSEQLSSEVLQAVIEEFVVREGTDYGMQEYSLQQKVAQVQRQLDSGRVAIVFDPVSESCTLMRKD